MNITRSESRNMMPGSDEYFSGTVKLDMLFTADAPSQVSGATVTFEPGARHIDLYDRTDLIPFDKLTSFFTDSLK